MMRVRMGSSARVFCLSLLMALGLLLASCGADAPLLPPANLAPEASPTHLPVRLMVLHTNDNWGETEPCG